MLHNGFSIQIVERRPAFRRPDGSVIERGSPPVARIKREADSVQTG